MSGLLVVSLEHSINCNIQSYQGGHSKYSARYDAFRPMMEWRTSHGLKELGVAFGLDLFRIACCQARVPIYDS